MKRRFSLFRQHLVSAAETSFRHTSPPATLVIPCLFLVLLAGCSWPMYRGTLGRTGQSSVSTSGDSGALVWTYTSDNFTGSGGYWPTGPVVGYSPVTGGVLIYAGDLTGTLYAFNPNGSVAWTISLLNNGGSVSASAVAADGTVYATSGYLYAVTPSGKLKWTFTPTGGLIPFSPAIGSDGTIYFGDQCGIFYALNPDGTMKWKFTKFEVAACPDAGENPIGTPALASNGTIYVWAEGTGINNGFVFALDPSGTLLWTNSSVSGSPSVGPNGTVYIDSAKQLYALNPSGVLQWTLTAPADAYFSLPAIANNNTIYLGTNTAGFYAVNPSGTIKWNSTPGGATLFWGPPSIGADGTIYDGGASPDVTGLFAINPDGTLKWAQPMCTATFVNEPAIGADGTIYVIPDFGPGACGSLYAFH